MTGSHEDGVMLCYRAQRRGMALPKDRHLQHIRGFWHTGGGERGALKGFGRGSASLTLAQRA